MDLPDAMRAKLKSQSRDLQQFASFFLHSTTAHNLAIPRRHFQPFVHAEPSPFCGHLIGKNIGQRTIAPYNTPTPRSYAFCGHLFGKNIGERAILAPYNTTTPTSYAAFLGSSQNWRPRYDTPGHARPRTSKTPKQLSRIILS